MVDALLEFEDVYPSHLATMTTHMFVHMPDYIRKWGPIKGSWAMWVERMVRDVRNGSAVENRSISALGNGYIKWRQPADPTIRERSKIIEYCRWWRVEEGVEGSEGITATEKLEVLEALRLDGTMPDECKVQTRDEIKMNSSFLFRMGEGIKFKNSTIKTVFAKRRKDAVRVNTYVVTLYDNGTNANGTPQLIPMVAQVLKIASLQCSENVPPAYALKVKVFLTTGTSIPNVKTVNINAQPRGSPAGGEWVGVVKSVSSRQPLMLPKVMHRSRNNVLVSSSSFDVCLVPED